MDNTLKLLISVLSIAGLIALFTPSPDDLPTSKADTAQAATATPDPAATGDRPAQPEVVAGEEAEEEDLLEGFGEPMNDGKPIDPLKENEAEEQDANNGQPSNDTTPEFSPPSDGGGASSVSAAQSAAPARAARALPLPVPIPNAPPVSTRQSM